MPVCDSDMMTPEKLAQIQQRNRERCEGCSVAGIKGKCRRAEPEVPLPANVDLQNSQFQAHLRQVGVPANGAVATSLGCGQRAMQ